MKIRIKIVKPSSRHTRTNSCFFCPSPSPPPSVYPTCFSISTTKQHAGFMLNHLSAEFLENIHLGIVTT